MHDTVEFEKRGVPATLVLTGVFRNAAIHQFRVRGMEGHPYVELPHPISNLTAEQMRTLTARHVDELARQLTT